MQKLILICLSFFVFSCSIQKRKYQNGYYVSWHHSSEQTKSKSIPTNIDEHIDNTVSFAKSKNALNDNELFTNTNPSKTDAATIDFLPSKNNLANDSCDNIIFRDGSEVLAKVLEISSTQIKYKRCDLPNGPLYTIKKSEVFMIKYASGVREVFKEESTPTTVSPPPVPKNYDIPNKTLSNNNQPKVHPKAIGAFVLGLLSLIFFFAVSSPLYPLLFLLSIIGSIVAISSSIKAIRTINNYPNDFKGKGLAITGRVFSIIVLALIFIVLAIVLSAI